MKRNPMIKVNFNVKLMSNLIFFKEVLRFNKRKWKEINVNNEKILKIYLDGNVILSGGKNNILIFTLKYSITIS